MSATPVRPPVSLAPDEGFLPLEVPGRHGVRLEQFQMLNWGTFDTTVARLDVDGSNALLTGNVGAGKSTIVDGLTTLFASAHKVTYNRAAGADRSERTLATYVLGHYSNVYDEATGSTRPQSLRERKSAYSVLLARFTGLPGPTGTLSAGAVFWFEATGVVHRLYFTAPAALDIAEHLAGHGDTRAVRAALRAAGGDLFDDNFRNYQRSLCRHLGISPAALDLLVQTVSMKSVGNLTDFVRAHMLDAVDARERIGKVLDHYSDLTRAHELVQTARRQLDALTPVAEAAAAYDRAVARTQASTEAAAAVPARVEQHRVTLLAAAIAELAGQMPAREAAVKAKRSELTGQETRRTQLALALQAGGGAELTEARLRMEAAETRLGDVRRAHVELVALAAQAGVSAPERTADHPRFLTAVKDVAARLAAAERDLRKRDFEAQSKLAGAREELRTLREELAAAGSRDSNVSLDDARLRGRIAEALGLAADTLPFAAELIAVAPESAEWEPAAERLVRPFALSLLVPEEDYARVAAWVDREHLGRRLVYFRVPNVVAAPAAPRAGTMAAHLHIRPGTPVSAWLRAEINRRFDHVCVNDATELSGHTRAVTRAGQVKDNARHEKDDRRRADDRRHYVLGWDTAARRAHLTAAIPGAQRAVEEAERAQEAVGKERSGNGDREYAVRQLTERFTDPSTVDVTTAVQGAAAARELHEKLASRPDIAELLDQQADCEQQISTLGNELSRLDRALGAATERLEQHRTAHDAAERALAAMPEPELSEEATAALADALRQAGVPPAKATDCDAWGQKVTEALRARAASASATRERTGRDLTNAMKDFAHSWPQMVVDIPSDPESRGEYLAIRDRLATDDLPSYEKQFREQLETNAIHELVGFSNFLDREAGKITARIDTINGALAEIDYRPGTYIRLEVERSADLEVREFRQQLRDITANTLLGDDDTYAESRFLLVKELLDRFQGREGNAAADERWTARVTDVRNWFSFAASERTREEDAPLEHYTDSGGKSGGQKEKLAYTILAASLSYQYGLAGGNVSAFRFVMIDEAFGRGSDESTRFGLELFTRLGLQLLVVTPLQKINTIAPFVDAVGYVRNDDPRSRLVTMTITEYQEQRARRAGQRLAERAVTVLPPADANESEVDPAVDGTPDGGDDAVAAAGGSW
ncbi:ATP-binding protein [Blastococcus tunisiensis]|uniref:Uncharacterized protein YPO0396 n=1 Tax=Blastococcus tunisiensis TaxID=1798228 RepID=A0A1I2IUH0_9ACTN|nr:SbcC/MukB-like Walker B domain-containing protein [Blastococcus sp. DSM 46838]SFF45380.1 Uncharacterized protein YPO0396 [Blastococcus sp. DSM 46838]